MSFTLSKHQGSLNRSRTVQQNNELMEALSPSQSDQSLNLVIGSRSIIPTIQAATDLIQFTFRRDDPESLNSSHARCTNHPNALEALKGLNQPIGAEQISCSVTARTTRGLTPPLQRIFSNRYAITFTSSSTRRSSTQAMERRPELASRKQFLKQRFREPLTYKGSRRLGDFLLSTVCSTV